ncbi:MAG: hypothetical protein CML46_15625 [Rhodobacteraceae bacterium]|nr:hypothetical protein [Paracoccaceae bacterium]MBR28353.1 hypothetical protein [Paracoccaceae bacterium]
MPADLLSLPPELTSAIFALITAASFCTSFLTAAFGLGGGVAMLAILASVLPPAALIPVHGLVQLASNTGRAASMASHIRWERLAPFLAGALIGAGAGGSVSVSLPGPVAEIGVGVFVAWSALATPPASLARAAGPAGFVSSFLTMFFGATGPFVAAYVKTLRLDRMSHVATHAAMMTGQHLIKVAVFGLLGFAFGPWLGPVAAMAAAGLAGTLAGKRFLARSNDARFHRFLTWILCLLAARLVAAGAMDLLAI